MSNSSTKTSINILSEHQRIAAVVKIYVYNTHEIKKKSTTLKFLFIYLFFHVFISFSV